MLRLKIGVKLASLRQPFKKALQTAARLGADAVEIDARSEINPREMSRTGIRHVLKMLDDFNLKVCAVSFPTRRGYDVLEELDRRVEATKQAMQMAYDLGAQVLVNQIGRVPADLESPSSELLIGTLSDIGRHGQRVGTFLAAKTGSEDPEDLLRLINHLPPGSLTVDLDPGNLIINGFSASDAVKLLGQHIIHVHARDGVRDLAKGRGLEVPLGRGSTDFPELLGVLEENEYRGHLTVEREMADDPVAEIQQAIEFLRNL